MTHDPTYNHLRELSWRRPLSDAELAKLRAWLASHPEAQTGWEAEAGLNAALGRLPNVPVPSNFTARVLQAAQRGQPAGLRRAGPSLLTWLRMRWLPKTAFAAVVVGVGLLTYHQVQATHRQKVARSLATVSAVSSMPSVESLKDFEAIRALTPTPAPDEELLALLQ